MSSFTFLRSQTRAFTAALAFALTIFAAYLSLDGLKVSKAKKGEDVLIRSNLHFHEVAVSEALLREALLSALIVNTWFYNNRSEDRRFSTYGMKDGLSVEKAVNWRFEKHRTNLKNFSHTYCGLSDLIAPTKPCPIETLSKLNSLIAAIRPDFKSQINIAAINVILTELVDKLIEAKSDEFFLPSDYKNTTVFRVLSSFINRPAARGFTLVQSHTATKTEMRFEIGVTLVTQEEWFEVMGYNPSFFQMAIFCPETFLRKNGVALCPLMPVESFSWPQLTHFLKRKNQLDPHFKFRLPTAEEWEFAARGGADTPYFFGETDEEIDNYSWYLKNSGLQTHDVAEKLPNAYGLYDATGNVWQLVNAPLNAITTKAPEGRDPSSAGYMIRGGSWIDVSQSQQLTNTSKIFDDWLCYDVGVRLVRGPK